MKLDLGVSEGQQNLYENCIHDFWMRFDEFSKGKEELLDHWIRPSFNLMSCLRPKHLFWFSNLRMKSQKLINWMIYMKSHLSDFTTDHNQQFQIKVRVTETWKYIAKTGQNFNKYIHTQDNLLHILYSLILVSMFTLSCKVLIARKSALKWHNNWMFWSPIIVLSKQIISDQNIR